MASELLRLRVERIRDEAALIRSFLLVDPQGASLPGFSPGAHVDLHLANGLVRSYSLLNQPGSGKAYEIAVARDAHTRGGSAFLFASVRTGDLIDVTPPRNHFALDESASHSVFIAGGIGITPILSMVHRMSSLGANWSLYYAGRTRPQTAFLATLDALGDRVHLHMDDEQNGLMDVKGILVHHAQSGEGCHVYACGPGPMLDAFQAASAAWNAERVHLERFAAAAAVEVSASTSFVVHLARSGTSVTVPPGVSILDSLLERGIELPYSCKEGTCGDCAVNVLDGVPEHRDVVLSKKRRAENKVMMICCSRARTETLTLDA